MMSKFNKYKDNPWNDPRQIRNTAYNLYREETGQGANTVKVVFERNDEIRRKYIKLAKAKLKGE